MAAAFSFTFSINGYAQSLPETRSDAVVIDPLMSDFRHPGQNGDILPKNAPQQDTSPNKIDNFASAAAGELDGSLNAVINNAIGNVNSTATQPDGKILIGGYFKTVNGVRSKSLVRLNTNNLIDSTFNTDINGTVLAIALQPDGKIVIGGSFTAVNGIGRNRIARLNSDGSLDTTFNPGTGADHLVYDVVVQPDGKILLGGSFFSVNSFTIYGVARLNANGSMDNSFVSPIPPPSFIPSANPPILNTINSIALQQDGKIMIAGIIIENYGTPFMRFTTVIRLNTNGSVDASFVRGNINSNAMKVAVQPDGKILIGGFFTTINGVNRNRIARLNTDGSLDTSFNPGAGADHGVSSIFLKPDGKILIGGNFFSYNGFTRYKAAQLNSDGSLDQSFVSIGIGLSGSVQSIVPASNG
jgi:uncharacterized delta-60 repeat protein